MVLGLDLVAMDLDQVELVLVQQVLDLVALDQVDMDPAVLGQDWVVSEPGQVVLDQVVLGQDQAAMDLVEQGLFLVFIQLEENHQNQV